MCLVSLQTKPRRLCAATKLYWTQLPAINWSRQRRHARCRRAKTCVLETRMTESVQAFLAHHTFAVLQKKNFNFLLILTHIVQAFPNHLADCCVLHVINSINMTVFSIHNCIYVYENR